MLHRGGTTIGDNPVRGPPPTPSRAIRITAVPRACAENAGLQAMELAKHYGDEVWALPAPGAYTGHYARVRLFPLDHESIKRVVPIRAIRLAFFLWLFLVLPFEGRGVFFVHSFLFGIPLWLMRKPFWLIFHGTDRRFLSYSWARRVTRAAVAAYGVGFSCSTPTVKVDEIPNIYLPAPPTTSSKLTHDVLFVLRNAPVKNPTYPIALAEAVPATTQLRIAVVGVSVEELSLLDRSRLRRLNDRGLTVQYMGRQPFNEVIRMMGSSNVLMIPSHAEGVPKAVLEGLSQGMRVLVNAKLVLPSMIAARVTAVNLEDWCRIAEFIERSHVLPRSTEGRAFALDYLDHSRHALFSLYDRIYAAHGGAGVVASGNCRAH